MKNEKKLDEAKPTKHSANNQILQKWRDMCGLVNNPKRRFRFPANVHEPAAMHPDTPSINQKLRVAVLVSKVALHLLNGVEASSHMVPEEFRANGFGISADDAASVVESRSPEKLQLHGAVDGLASKLKTCTTNGLAMDDKQLTFRQQLFGTNEFTKREQLSFWVCLIKALQDMSLMVLAVCAFVSLLLDIVTEHDGLGIFVASILLVMFVTATSDYRQSLQVRDKRMFVHVTRNGYRQKLSICEVLPGDIVHLAIGDQVPADGLFISGSAVSIDESSLIGESELIKVNTENRYLFCGTKVQDGSCKMLLVAVGMRTQWGKLMATHTKGGNDETQLQVKLKRVATIIGKMGIVLAIVKFVIRL